MAELGQAGFTTNEIIAALPKTLQLAVAAQTGIADAAGVTAKAMKAFGIDAEDMGRVNDALVSTINRSTAGITDLAEALKHAAPVAASVGVDIETTALLAEMADAGFTGSTGGTHAPPSGASLALFRSAESSPGHTSRPPGIRSCTRKGCSNFWLFCGWPGLERPQGAKPRSARTTLPKTLSFTARPSGASFAPLSPAPATPEIRYGTHSKANGEWRCP